MSQVKELSISYEDIRCASCKGYLSCAPIQVLTNGDSICGNCSPLYVNENTQRVLTLEAMLRKLSFPCQFQQQGCEKEFPFGYVTEHEIKCNYRSFNCPFLPINNCLWSGSVLQMHKHFIDLHPDSIIRDIEFKIDVNQNKEDILLVEVEDVKFLVKYIYCSDTSNLWYNIKYLSLNVEEVSSKIVLKNDVEEGYSITLKGNDCLLYEGNFINPQNQNDLFLNKLLPILKEPHRVLITIDLFVRKIYNEDEVSINNNTEEEDQEALLIVDYDLLEKLRCSRCKLYLVPPVFVIEGTAGFLCYNCKKLSSVNPIPLQNNTMIQRWIGQANYPCRWRDCKYVGKANDITEHERICLHRIYNCCSNDCKTIFKMEEVFTHLSSHGYKYFEEELVYTLILSGVPRLYAQVFTQKCNEIVIIKRYTKEYGSIVNKEYLHKIMLFVPSTNRSKIKAKVQIEHAHCKIKSPVFIVKSGLYFGINKMPGCFKIDEELTVTVTLQY